MTGVVQEIRPIVRAQFKNTRSGARPEVFHPLLAPANHTICIDDPNLDVEANDILVLQNAGPHSESAMPEAGYLPIPRKLAQSGVEYLDATVLGSSKVVRAGTAVVLRRKLGARTV